MSESTCPMPGMQRTSVATMSLSLGMAVTSRRTRRMRTSLATVANSPVPGTSESTMMPKSNTFQPLAK